MSDSFFVPLGPPAQGRWLATGCTNGPWAAGFQHGGPPAALLGRAIERVAPREDVVVARVTVEILGPIPVGELELTAQVIRPGRSVELVEATMSAGGRAVASARAWRVLRTGLTEPGPTEVAPLPQAQSWTPPSGWLDGYLSSIEWRIVQGGFADPGPATAWARMRVPLVADEEPSPLQRVLVVADSGNGLSSRLDPTQWYFINPELTVHLHREAVGEWICLDARTTVSPVGAGLATSVLSDQQGPVGIGAQSLLVSPR